jgi:drug/metabolite transporter (DMT)-like permease
VTPRHVALLALLSAIWGASYLLIKYAIEDFGPAEVVFLRTALAGAVLYAVIHAQGPAMRGELRRALGKRWMIVLLGATAITAPFMLITFGERAIPSGLTAVLIAPASLFVAMLAPFLDPSERINRAQTAGLVMGLGGVALLVGIETVSTLDEFLGAMAMLGAALFYATSNYIVKGPFKGYPAIVNSFLSVTAGAVLSLPLAAATMEHHGPGLRAVLAIVGLGVVGTAAAFVIFYKLIAEIGAGRAALVSYTTPPVALLYGALLLDEEITTAAIVGLVMILAGVALASRRAGARAEEAPEVAAGVPAFRP